MIFFISTEQTGLFSRGQEIAQKDFLDDSKWYLTCSTKNTTFFVIYMWFLNANIYSERNMNI